MICTNAARAYVAWLNVTIAVGIYIVPETYLWGLVRVESVTAEIFLTWTNVTGTNVAWTNVPVTVEICSRCSQELTFKVSSKSGQ